MSKCERCKLCQSAMSQVLPRGTSSPELYFVSDNPDEEDSRFGQSLSGARGRYLDVFLKSLGATENRYFSLIRCCPYSMEYPQTIQPGILPSNGAPLRYPEPEELSACAPYLKMDIFKTAPKVIVTLGGLATKQLLNKPDIKISRVRGEIHHIEINGKQFVVVPTYSPSYLIKNPDGREIAEEFFRDLKKAHEIAQGTYVDIMDTIDLNYAKTYEEFKDYAIKELSKEVRVAYDIETNAELIYSDRFKIIGFSLSKKHNGIYVCLDSLEYTMSQEEQDKCRDLLLAILKPRTVTVHNSNYERPATLFQYGYELPPDTTEDTLVMSKLMLGGKIGAGLKPQAMKIGYPAWDKDVDIYISNVKALIKRLKLVKFKPVVASMKEGKNLYELLEFMTTSESSKVYQEIIDYVKDLISVIGCYYDKPEHQSALLTVMKRIPEVVLTGMEEGIPGTIPYNWIPCNMLCKYGATDAIATYDLEDHMRQRFKNESTDEVDLAKGYKYYLSEHYTGFAMIMSSLKWDDDAAQHDYDFFNGICVKSLKFLCTHPLVQSYIIEKEFMNYAPEIIYDNYNDYLKTTFDKRILLTKVKDDGTKVFKLEVMNEATGRYKKLHIKHLMEEVTLSDSITKDINTKTTSQVMKVINSCDDLEKLRKYFNPTSTRPEISELATRVLLTDEFRFAKLIKEFELLLAKEDFKPKKLKGDDKVIIDAVSAYLDITAKNYPEKWIEMRRVEYPKLRTLIRDEVGENNIKNVDMQKAVGLARNLLLESLADETQIMIYESLKMSPINPDDPTTWTYMFRWLVLLRWYKKSMKVMGSYINGKVGRASVWTADKKALAEGDDIVKRYRPYSALEHDENGKVILEPNEDFIEQTSFGIGTAETFRWKSAYHTLPTGSSVKKLYTSRFVGGTVLCLEGASEVALMDGTTKTIKELADIGENQWIYSMNEDLEFVPKLATKPRLTSYADTTYKIHLNDGTSVECTGEHMFYNNASNKWVQAKSLVRGDSLASFSETIKCTMSITDIEILHHDTPKPMYCMTVPDTECFMLANGLITHNCPDYSANEVRCIASAAQEKSMLAAFARGADIHLSNAAMIYGLPEEEITSFQRRFAKTATFSILYGASPYSVAENYFNGNISQAEKLLDDFYTAFPAIKTWIDARHEEVMKTHKVSVLTQRFINIDFNPNDQKDLSTAMRRAQNFPISYTA